MFIPLHDHNKLTHVPRPYVNLGLIAANFIVYFVLQGAGQEQAMIGSSYSYGLIPSVFFDLRDLSPQLQMLPDTFSIVTYAFLHGGFMHLIGNMLFLWVFGDNVEDAMGHLRYLVFYLLCAAAGGYTYAVLDQTSDIPLVGASGAVSGVVAAYLMLHPNVKIWVLALGRIPLRLTARWVLGAWVLYQVFNVAVSADSQVAWIAHIGGLVAGALLIIPFRRRGVPLFDRGMR
ncbi:rhomboid family intramembrane serine protease [Roseibium denhamense]|uniref:Membrane associated serine protease, rhomboid family n=1 Tax=Roseibium denhamense TaxID=76305 RepID=A0ABY1PAX7_9HYPH|nr:rhomboid family intramembrane serine protease [Roseibium denhamense]MTI05313.1 rhomboid family intramembrane serine protease [Roseibium denhamense]SMP30406.1 Membrane associated serine protease, rhomboid family [Roseibium denhamense]